VTSWPLNAHIGYTWRIILSICLLHFCFFLLWMFCLCFYGPLCTDFNKRMDGQMGGQPSYLFRSPCRRSHIKHYKVRCERLTHPLHDRLWAGNGTLDPIKIAYNPYRPDSPLKLTTSTFNQLKPVYTQQSWSQGTLYYAKLAVSSQKVAETIGHRRKINNISNCAVDHSYHTESFRGVS